MAAAADDEVIMHSDTERRRGLDDVLSHRDVRDGWGRIAGGMVVHQNQCRCAEVESPSDYLARINRRMVYRPALYSLIPDQCVLTIKEEDMKLFNLAVGYSRTAVVN